MKEEFLHYVWANQLFSKKQLLTTEGDQLVVLKTGFLSQDGGPDFIQSKLKIHNTLWVGNVEIHVRSSLWESHGHTGDAAYDTVVLHVVWEDDRPVSQATGELIPCLELKGLVLKSVIDNYEGFMNSSFDVPCHNYNSLPKDVILSSFLGRLMVERLERKTIDLDVTIEAVNQDWEEAFYRCLAKAFGHKVNALPMELLATHCPLRIIKKYRYDRELVEALLFGVAGFLDEELDDLYHKKQRSHWIHLKGAHGLTSLDKSIWKLLRLRPANFPTRRISQMAGLLFEFENLLDVFIQNEAQSVEELLRIDAAPYWNTHYVFGKETKRSSCSTGASFCRGLIINCIAPFLFFHGLKRSKEAYKERALDLLEQVPAEKNRIIDYWNERGVSAKNAGDTQAILEMNSMYCAKRKCLKCVIGHGVLKGK